LRIGVVPMQNKRSDSRLSLTPKNEKDGINIAERLLPDQAGRRNYAPF
jgi:hypothetical protein